jgi:acyl dehydratase
MMGRIFEAFTIGQRFETPGRTITKADIAVFAGLTGDFNPVHTDEVFARAAGFDGRIAHGPMGIGIAFGLAAELDLIDGTVIALLGVDWNFKAPMLPGDTIRAVIEVNEMRDVGNRDRGLLGLAFTLLDQRDMTVQTGSARLLMRRSHYHNER